MNNLLDSLSSLQNNISDIQNDLEIQNEKVDILELITTKIPENIIESILVQLDSYEIETLEKYDYFNDAIKLLPMYKFKNALVKYLSRCTDVNVSYSNEHISIRFENHGPIFINYKKRENEWYLHGLSYTHPGFSSVIIIIDDDVWKIKQRNGITTKPITYHNNVDDLFNEIICMLDEYKIYTYRPFKG